MSSVPNLLTAPTRYGGNPVLPLAGASAWWAGQLFDFVPIFDPADASRILIYVSGMASPPPSGDQSIGRFHASVSDPYTWTEDGQYLTKNGSGWESGGGGLRVGSVIYDSGTYYLFYNCDTSTSAIGLATSTDGVSFTKHASNPILTATGNSRNDGTHVSQPAVIKEGSSWTMVYSYRTSGSILPALRYATSSDGVTWTKGGSGDIFSFGGLYCEWHQLIKLGTGSYAVICECGNDTTPFRLVVGLGTTPTSFTAGASAWFTESGTNGAIDRYHVATGAIFPLNASTWLLFYCGAGNHDQPYYTNTWAACLATVANTTVSARTV